MRARGGQRRLSEDRPRWTEEDGCARGERRHRRHVTFKGGIAMSRSDGQPAAGGLTGSRRNGQPACVDAARLRGGELHMLHVMRSRHVRG